MPSLTLVIPTFNERENISPLISKLTDALDGIDWEVVYVDDDSQDGTAQRVRDVAQENGRVRCIHRIGRRGLSSAVIEGAMSSSSPFIAVMDADLQHDERILPEMLRVLNEEGCDIVVGSRYTSGGGIGEWDASRAKISDFATKLSKLVLKADVNDPMSGFFVVKRNVFEDCVRRLSGIGFKILLDIFASSPRPLAHKEVPYEFRTRVAGESKLDTQAAWGYLMLLLDKLVGRYVPVRFLAFTFVGGIGVLVHLAIFVTLFQWLGNTFFMSQAVATVVAMTFNYLLNNFLTYRDMRLKGLRFLTGWISFCLACSIGAVANVGVAVYLFQQQEAYWLLSALAGILVGAVWNYAVTAVYTWQKPKNA